MKKLFLLFSFLVAHTNLTLINNALLFANKLNHKNLTASVQSLKIFYNQNHSSELIFSSYNKDTYYYSTYSIPLGKNLPVKFKNVYVMKKEDCYTKTSWGNTPYYGTPLWKKIDNCSFLSFAPNLKVFTHEMIKKNANICLMNTTKYYRSAYIFSKQYVGFTWYYNNSDHNFYLELLVYFYTWVWGSAIGGARWVNLGAGLEIILG